jgi:serine/threonine protein kinase
MRKDGPNSTTVRLPPLSLAQKLTMCHQVSLGMEALADSRLVLRDLAARNVLLSASLDVKVAGLSLCRDVYAAEYAPWRQRLVPVRWTPSEVLEDDSAGFTTASDVYSFGVLVWEVFTLGDLPLRHLSDDDVVRERKLGSAVARLTYPPGCPPDLWQTAERCLVDQAVDRPSFGELSRAIGEMTASTVI